MGFWGHGQLHPWDDAWQHVGFERAVIAQEFRKATDDDERLRKYMGALVCLLVKKLEPC